MIQRKTLLKGLLGASALTAFSAGNAFAQTADNNYTAAGTPVDNTFTLTYDVGGGTTETITNTAGTPNDPDGPTRFTVDRLVNVIVDTAGDVNVNPGQTDAVLTYTVENIGNDTHGYALSIFEESTAPDTEDTDDPVSAIEVIRYRIDTNKDGAITAADDPAEDYIPGSPPQLDADQYMEVYITQDIRTSSDDGDIATITLVADTLDAGTTTPTDPDAGGNTLDGAAENVLADGSSTGREGANAGDDSAVASYLIESPEVAAVKAVALHSQDGSTCTTFPGTTQGTYPVPGACMEYVITVTNTGSQDATTLTVNDILPAELEFQAATTSGFTGGSFSPALPTAGTDCAGSGGTACTVNFTGATLAAPASLPGSVVGTVTIRATVK